MSKSSGVNLSKNIAINHSSIVSEICESLSKDLQLTYFNYVKLYPDGKRALLTNRPEWLEVFYANELYKLPEVKTIENHQIGDYQLWATYSDQSSFEIASQEHNIANGITISISLPNNITELYYFGTTRNNYHMQNVYLNNIDSLESFIRYFKNTGEKIIALAESNLIVTEPEPKIELLDMAYINEKIEEFMSECKVSSYTINANGVKTKITKNEAQFIRELATNLSISEIALRLNKSKRTADDYVERIKDKFMSDNISQLRKIIAQNKLGDKLY
ncbi:MAG: helix-turn-helix domain-containing protein [Gammaproteobacteria bacterium]|nr:helix-turn-helix domain-containing protein [Gammaproteobacteria bacterium]